MADQGVRGLMYSLLAPLGLYRLSGDTLVDCELGAYLDGLEYIENRLGTLLRELHIQTAQSYGLALWERLTGMPRFIDISTEQKRDMLLHRLSLSHRDFTPAGIWDSLRSAGMLAQLSENGETLLVTVGDFIGDENTIDAVKDSARAMLPAHIESSFAIGTFTWDMFDAPDRSFAQLDALGFTWLSFDMMGL